MKKTLTLIVLAALAMGATFANVLPTLAPAVGSAEDHAAVERAVLDYLEGIYEVKPEYIERSVHADLVKYGFWRKDASEDYRGVGMTKEQLVQLAGKWNEDGKHARADSPKEIVIFDVLDKTAAAKLTAEWGIDYFHLAKLDGKWQITQIVWQSHPMDEGDEEIEEEHGGQ